ncbi:hypothetical protein [Bacillus sp. REN3]|uniref:hypothetical protein n=1 Tax=Bacillus sp. REN3 TaxID=2802440 RepID=UPI001AEE4DBD|nr:hypothetical protein [Bacillus sp. REN3]
MFWKIFTAPLPVHPIFLSLLMNKMMFNHLQVLKRKIAAELGSELDAESPAHVNGY